MSDPLLTIEEVTREYRVSPKTVRRRIAAGEIDGAYKRPGARGPEWVMPRSALDEVGFVRRDVASGADVPTADGPRADYWARRALDAEAALRLSFRSRPAASEPGRRPRRGRLVVPLVVVTLVVIGLLAGLLAAGGDDADPVADEAVRGTRAVLTALTEPGDAIGVLGDAGRDVLPPERGVMTVDAGELDAVVRDDRVRYVVAEVEGPEPSGISELRRSSAVVLDLPRPGGAWVVFDLRAAAGSARPRSDAVPAPRDEEATAGAADDEPDQEPAMTGSASAGSGGDGSGSTGSREGDGAARASPAAPPATDAGATRGAAAAPRATPPFSVEVAPGDSFWSIAVGLAEVEAGGPASDAAVLEAWTSLMKANADRLVEAGNPDLLYVGQVLTVPSRHR